MPDYSKKSDAVTAYQKYYIMEKADFATWKYRDKPEWFKYAGEQMELNV